MNQNEMIKSAIKDLRMGALFSFIGINLRVVSGNILNALIFFNVLQSENPGRRFDIHAPSIPDMCCDMTMVIVFAIAHQFITSNRVKNLGGIFDRISEMNNSQYFITIGRLKNYIHRSRNLFSLAIIGISMYYFSRYVMSVWLEISLIVKPTGIFFLLNLLNDFMKLCSPLILVAAYCKYISPNKSIKIMLYLFFSIRNLFVTNVMGLITIHDLHVGAPFLDVLSPLIIIYSVISIIRGSDSGSDLL